ncbi:hypothetical protein [Streptomyces cucumeris]|uniref:hypothetical protein n=1 Tax=Streptomyces cucumeris TaxID=2962890 RepID=UPI003D72CAA2
MFRNRARGAGFLAVAAAVGSLTAMPTARADDRPSDKELLDQCNNGTRSCVFHPSGQPDIFPGDRQHVGDFAYNCTRDPQLSSITWTDTTGSSNSVGVAIRAEYKFAEVFTGSVETSFKHTWTSEHSETATTMVDVPPGEVGWVTREPQMQRVKGTYELVFKKRYKGHYYWYVPFEATGPVADMPSSRTQHTRRMTAREKAENCG